MKKNQKHITQKENETPLQNQDEHDQNGRVKSQVGVAKGVKH